MDEKLRKRSLFQRLALVCPDLLQSTRGATTFVAKYQSSFPMILKAQQIRDANSGPACSGAPELNVFITQKIAALDFDLYTFLNSQSLKINY